MNLLLDTHTFLWLVEGNPNLSSTAQIALADPGNSLSLSVASIWELAIKTSKPTNPLVLAEPLDLDLARWMPVYGISTLPITAAHVLGVVGLPHHHQDPFDRVLIAQALVEGMTLVGSDFKFQTYGVPLLW